MIRIDSDFFCFLYIFPLVPVQHKGIVTVKALIMPAWVRRTFKAILNIAMLYTAWSHWTDLRTKAVSKAAAAVTFLHPERLYAPDSASPYSFPASRRYAP